MTKPQNTVLDAVAQKETQSMADILPRVVKEHGKSLGGQLKELASLSIRNNKLLANEYYDFCLFDDKRFTKQQKKEFVGINKSTDIWKKFASINPWAQLIESKIGFEVMMKGIGLKTTNTIAVISAQNPLKVTKNLKSTEELHAFFSAAKFPLFGKPSNSLKSLGAVAFKSYDKDKQEITTVNGERFSLEDMWKSIHDNFKSDYLIQEYITPHPFLKNISASGLSTIRIATLDQGNGPEVYRASMKISGKNNMADNFWRDGNLLAAVDCETGKLHAGLDKSGIDGSFHDTHPETGVQIKGEIIPHWDEAKEAVLYAAKFFENSILIGFDVTITKDGPLIVEANNSPDLGILQVAHGKGLLDDQMLGAIEHAEQLYTNNIQTNKKIYKTGKTQPQLGLKQSLNKKVA
ncbi:MAG: sugar-transfer associated ATP-grasp domain-containing protein [Hyphomicrobiales bacterium]